MWIIWRQKNDWVFNALQWSIEKTHQVIWDASKDYNRMEWQRTLSEADLQSQMGLLKLRTVCG